MPVLRWRHGKTASEAVSLMKQQLATAGYAGQVTWNDNAFSASVGPGGMLLSIHGRITEDEAILDSCGGIGAGAAGKIRGILEQSFPGGEVK